MGSDPVYFLFDPAFFQMHHPACLGRRLRIVRDHDRLPELAVEAVAQRQDFLAVVRSRSPVGSSAAINAGSVISARAIATSMTRATALPFCE